MDSSSSKNDKGQKNRRFFKIILDDNLREGKLAIPKRFVRKYGSDLLSSVLLKVPTGAPWQVELIKCNGEIWLGKGWQDFAKYYSLAHGHLLVFELEGSCSFHILVFDMTSTEIDYRCSPIYNGNKDVDIEKGIRKPKMERTEEDDVSFESLDKSSHSKKKKATGNCEQVRHEQSSCQLFIEKPYCSKTLGAKLPIQCTTRAQKRMRVDSVFYKLETTSEFQTSVPHYSNWYERLRHENSTRNVNPHYSLSQVEGKSRSSNKNSSNKTATRMRPLTDNERDDALKRASASFKSKNPHFMVAMQPSYVQDGRSLSIPASFAKKYLKKERGEALLCGLDWRTWQVKFMNIASRSAKFLSGWKAFVQDNFVEVGDVCVFEMVDATEIQLKVIIFKVDQDANSPFSQGKGGDESRFCRASAAFQSKNPFCMVAMQPSYVNGQNMLMMPSGFARDYMAKPNGDAILCALDGRTWPVKFCHCGKSAVHIYCGWRAFAQDNYLEVGDVCIFELIDSAKMTFNVVISKATQDICGSFLVGNAKKSKS